MSKKIIKVVDITSEPATDVLTWFRNQDMGVFNALVVCGSVLDKKVITELVEEGKKKNVEIIVDILLHVLDTYVETNKSYKLSKKDFVNPPKWYQLFTSGKKYFLKHTPDSMKYISHKLKEYRDLGITKFVVKNSFNMDKNLLSAILTQDELNKGYTLYEDSYMHNIEDITRSLYYMTTHSQGKEAETLLVKVMRTIDKVDFTHNTFSHKNEFFVDVIGTHIIFDNQSKYDYKVHSKFPALNLLFTTNYTTNVPGLNIVDGNIEGTHIILSKK